MFYRFAQQIRDNLPSLIDQYDARLKVMSGYEQLSETAHRKWEGKTLSILAAGLEANVDDPLIEHVARNASEAASMGFDPEWFQQAIVVLEDILPPLAETLPESSFIWHTLNRAQAAVWRLVSGERKTTEEKLAQERQLIRILIDNLPDQIFFKDTQGRVILNNIADARAMGVASPDEAVGKSVFDAYPPELAQLYAADDRAVIESGQPLLSREEPSRDETGRQRWTLTTKVPIADSHGKRLGLVGIARDITERKRLEQQIHDSLELRTSQVQVSTQVTQDIAAAPSLAELFQRVVTLVKERFNYYHAQIFRYEPSQDALVLIAGYGEAGQKLLTAGHRLMMGRGVVGTAATTAHSVLATDVTTNPDWQPNPYLPNTKGELAVPITLRDEVLGILDVQSDRAGALTQEDQLLLESLCGQIAVAIESTRLLQKLRADEAQLAEALQIAKLAYWEYDLEKQLYLFNDQFYAIFHTTAEQQGGYQLTSAQYAQRFVHPEDRSVVGAQIQKALRSTDPHYSRQIEHRILYADGGVGYVSASINIDLDEHGHIVRYYGANQDITASKLAEEAVRRSEAQLSEALHIAKLAYWEYDVPNDRFHFNDQFYSIFHTTAEEHGGYQLSSAYYAQHFVHPDDLAVVGTEIEKALTSTDQHYSRQIDHRILYADGGVGYISVSINIDRDDQGHILRYYGANQDITASKLAEAAVRRSEAELAQALQIAKLAYWEYDVAKDLFHFNDQFYAIFHTTAEQQGGYQISSAQYAQRFVHPDDLAVVGTEIEKALTSTDRHYSRQIDHRILYADGGVGHISVSINIDRDDQGHILRYYGANQDITASKLAEAAVRRSEAELAQALQIAKLAYWEYDVEKDLFLFNDQFYSIFHTTAEDEGGYQLSSAQYAQKFVHPDDLAVVGTEIEKALTSTDRHYSRQLDHRILYADGGVGYISVSINIDRDDQGHILRYYGANQDITAQKRNEQQMQETLHEMERLYAVVSHEGWQTYRQSGRMPAGYQFDQTLVQPANQVWTPEIEQAILHQKLVASQTADQPMAAAPIKVRGEIIGVLGVYTQAANPLQPEELALVESVSEQAALALESARLFEQIGTARAEAEARLREAQILHQLSQTVSRTLDVDRVLDALMQTLEQQMGFEFIAIALIEREAGLLRTVRTAGATGMQGMVRTLESVKDDITLNIANKGQIEVIDGWDERFDRAIFEREGHARLVRAFVPLMLRGQPLGVIEAGYLREKRARITPEEVRVLGGLADQVAITIDNARLLEQTQRDAERERVISHIAGQIRSAQSVEQVLRIATQELRLATRASRSVAEIAPAVGPK